MKAILRFLFFPFTVIPMALAKPLPETVVAQAAARIDYLLNEDLARTKLKPNTIADDATFLRRSYLGIVGRIPSGDEAAVFLSDPSPKEQKREKQKLTRSLSCQLYPLFKELDRNAILDALSSMASGSSRSSSVVLTGIPTASIRWRIKFRSSTKPCPH